MQSLMINFGHIEIALASIAIFLIFPTAKMPYQVSVSCFLALVYVDIKNYAAV